MKGPSCTLVASVLAASTVAITSSAGYLQGKVTCSCAKQGAASTRMAVTEKEKFAPRFDGLRFIETLVTAHR